MPAYSTLRHFIDAVKTGDTNITRCLEKLANDQAKRQKYSADIRAPHGAIGHLPGWMRNEMVQAGMSQPEVDHVERWPDSEKEKARRQIVESIDSNTVIHFSWELYDGDMPLTEIRRDPNQDVRIVFRSPRKGVVLSFISFGGVKVEA